MKRVIITILPIIFLAQACNFLFGDLSRDQGSGNRGIFISTDSGQSWEMANKESKDKSLAAAQIMRIVLEGTNPKNLIAASFNAGFFASDSAEKKWFPLLPNFTAYDAFFNPYNSEEIFAAGSRNKIAIILKSPDRGGTWIQIYNQPAGQASVTTLSFDPKNPAVFYAGLSTGTVLKSIDFGKTWNTLIDFKDRILRILLTPNGQSIYLLARSQGLRRSEDGGKTWSNLSIPDSPAVYNDLVLDPKNPAVLYLGTDKGLFLSQNSGASWTKLSLPASPQLYNISAVEVNPKDSRQIFAAIRSTVYRSDDRGVTWQIHTLPTNRTISDIVIDPQEPNRIYAGLK